MLLLSINDIARQLNARRTSVGRRSKSTKGWSAARVKKLLSNPKYHGDWSWGLYHTVKLNGRRRNYASEERDKIQVSRSGLAIVDEETWNKAQERFRKFKTITGTRRGGEPKKRLGIFAREYPASLLSGLLFCHECGTRLHFTRSNTTEYFRCPLHARGGGCDSRSIANRKKSEAAIVDFLGRELSTKAEWLEDVYKEVLCFIQSHLDNEPSREKELLSRKEKLETTKTNYLENMKFAQSASLAEGLRETENDLSEIQRELDRLRRRAKAVAALPGKDEVAKSMENLLPIFTEEPQRGAYLLRTLLGRVYVEDVVFPGKKRGYARLTFRFSRSTWMRTAHPAFGDVEAMNGSRPEEGEEIVLYTGEPTKLECLMPQIHAWVEASVQWREIGKRTGLSVCSANQYYRNWREAIREQSDSLETKNNVTEPGEERHNDSQ